MTKAKTTTAKTDTTKTKEINTHLEKVVLNVGVGKMGQQAGFESKTLPQIIGDLAMIAGQAPQVRRAKKSIAGFKLRQGQIVGLKVTLRRTKMVDFFERLITIVLPRVHDFGGLDPHSVDQRGTLNVGLSEQFVFPEINPEESTFTFPLGINIVPKVKDREEALNIYKKLGTPLKDEDSSKKRKKAPKKKPGKSK